MTLLRKLVRRSVIVALLGAYPLAASADASKPITLPGDQAYPESMSAGSDGTIFVGSLAGGGIMRIKPGAAPEQFVAPGAFGTRSTFGVLVDEATKTLWVCSNDVSSLGIPGPSTTPGAYVKGFDLQTGQGKVSAQLPGKATVCNDMVVSPDGSLLVTNTAAPQILRLAPKGTALEVWVEDPLLVPKNGTGLDGIAFGDDGNLYVNTYGGSEFFRVEVKDGKAGAVTKLQTSRQLKFPDGLRHLSGNTFLMVEGAGTLDRVTIEGGSAKIDTIKDGLNGPTSLWKAGDTVWVSEGQLSHLFAAKQAGPPKLPFQIVPIAFGN
jgi:sugar lactone lactonase YvrE